uniref:mannitol dehydrogenase family protein n=1 Tax=Parafrankia discariae TaxID=365528 RepID=UPI0012B67FF6|nr:mannitol dehydrogenase family protein [Parafrankia discariae]
MPASSPVPPPPSSRPAAVAQPLSRSGGDGRPAAPVRILHLGLGSFFRAHQAWYTDRAPDARQWGIAAFSHRRQDLAHALTAQDGLYTLLTRGAEGDRFDVISSLAAAHAGSDHDAWLAYWRQPALAVVTLTVTEAGYARDPDGGLDLARGDVAADIAALRTDPGAPVMTAPARLLAGLHARARAGRSPVATVPCDNLAGNGAVAGHAVRELAAATGRPELVAAADGASWVTTMVDRITPGTTDADADGAAVRAATGHDDAVPVVTEPFSEWVLSGDFPGGRPEWEHAGARFVADLTPFENRKLWLLNGAHSLLAYAGPRRGHVTVAQAVADPRCRGWLIEWWAEASRHLGLPGTELDSYRQALLGRFENPRIRHLLAQIAVDGSQKLPVRILPVLRAERARGVVARGGARVIAAWMLHLREGTASVRDAEAGRAVAAARAPLPEAARLVLDLLGPGLGRDGELVAAVVAQVTELGGP